jgi:hypothetical protein
MRLFNRESLQLEFFQDEPYPAYAILSHRWTDSEMILKDLQDGKARSKEGGFKKMEMTCTQAQADELNYIWIDTFCIDKESSAELSESINSMFAWYKRAAVCYAYLADVACEEDGSVSDDFDKSEWFERGWTLQELIAPKEVVFYSKEWVEIGTRSSLAKRISRVTKIDEGILTGVIELRYVSIAKRMSWAADRKTTRKEDTAYCLAGLFDVNMATLYGEGSEKAFRRLQEEIMKDSDDESLFAWTNERKDQPRLQGLLATSPADFRNSGQYIPDYGNGTQIPSSTTGRGLCITLGMRRLKDDIWVGALQCPVPPEYTQTLAIYLQLLDESAQQYARVKADTLCKISQPGPLMSIYVRQKPHLPGFDDVYLHHAFQLRKINFHQTGGTGSMNLSNSEYQLLYTEKNYLCGLVEPLPTAAQPGVPALTFEIPRADSRLAALIAFGRPDGSVVFIVLGSNAGVGPGIHIFSDDSSKQACSLFSRSLQAGTDWIAARGEGSSQNPNADVYLQNPGTLFRFDQDSIKAEIQTRRHAGIRYYLVDITIILPKVLSFEDVVPMPGVSTHRMKLKNPFRSSKRSLA